MGDADDAAREVDARAGLEALNTEYVDAAAKQLRDAGVPDHLAEAALAAYAEKLAAQLDHDWPMIVRDMQISAGRARLQ